MLSKILIDVDEQGLSTIEVRTPKIEVSKMDVRDKLVQRFLEGGSFAIITYDSVDNMKVANIHSMNALDVLQNILDVFRDSVASLDSGAEERFEQAIFKAASMIESVVGYRSRDFCKKADAQKLV